MPRCEPVTAKWRSTSSATAAPPAAAAASAAPAAPASTASPLTAITRSPPPQPGAAGVVLGRGVEDDAALGDLDSERVARVVARRYHDLAAHRVVGRAVAAEPLH